MATPKKGLGRGLAALIPEADMGYLSGVARGDIEAAPLAAALEASLGTSREAQGDARPHGTGGPSPLQWIPIDAIEANPYQPRRFFDEAELEELAASIREHGVMQPILVRPRANVDGAYHFQLIAGERRWRAARAAGLEKVPALVRQVEDQHALELALIENLQRHDIGPLDAALAYRQLASEFGLSQEQVADRVGKSRSAVANTLRLLDLPEEARKAIEDGLLTEGHGRAILQADGEGARRAVLRSILRDKLSVREAEALARKSSESSGKQTAPPRKRVQTAEITQLTETLQRRLGTRVAITPKGKRGGAITLYYHSLDDLERLLPLLGERIP